MSPGFTLSAGFGLLVMGVLMLPVHEMPHTMQATNRMVVAVLMLVFGGALIGRGLT